MFEDMRAHDTPNQPLEVSKRGEAPQLKQPNQSYDKRRGAPNDLFPPASYPTYTSSSPLPALASPTPYDPRDHPAQAQTPWAIPIPTMHYSHTQPAPRPSIDSPLSPNDNGSIPRLSVDHATNGIVSAPTSRPASRGTDEAALTLRIPSFRLALDIWTGERGRRQDYTDMGGSPFDVHFTHNEIVLHVRKHEYPLKIKLCTGSHNIKIYLPRTFNGILTHEVSSTPTNPSSNGPHYPKPHFSQSLKAHTNALSNPDAKRGKSFVGDWQNHVGVSESSGDRCDVSTKTGTIWFGYEDETEGEKGRRGSWLKSLRPSND